MLRRIWDTLSGQMLVSIPKENDLGLGPGMYVSVERAQPPVKHAPCKVCGKDYQKHTLEELIKHGLWVK
jgi:hypothetical protein